jgi:hypothetical protein
VSFIRVPAGATSTSGLSKPSGDGDETTVLVDQVAVDAPREDVYA